MKWKDINWSYVRNVFLLIVSCLAILFILTLIHELIHASLYESYGCSHYTYFEWVGGKTNSLCSLTIGADKLAELDAKENLIDTISYPLFYILLPIIGGGMFILFRKKDWL